MRAQFCNRDTFCNRDPSRIIALPGLTADRLADYPPECGCTGRMERQALE
jgi:hypothetical protein